MTVRVCLRRRYRYFDSQNAFRMGLNPYPPSDTGASRNIVSRTLVKMTKAKQMKMYPPAMRVIGAARMTKGFFAARA